jgi:AhpD family alkylhydroperoxidase
MAGQRIAAGGLAELGVVNWVIWRALSRAAGTPNAHLFSTLGRQRRLFRGWLRFSARLMPGGSISRHETEIVILRVAHLRQCAYEMDHHTRIGKRVGVNDETLQRILEGPSSPGWNDRHRALLTAVDALVRDKDIGDAEWAALDAHYSEPQLIELCMLVGQYEMLATSIRALRIERDFDAA